MPETFASLLEALDAEGRELARPVPAAVIETRARGRRRRRRFTAATSAVAVCAIAAGVALGAGGTKSDQRPIAPASSPRSASSSASSSAPSVASQNRVGADALMQLSEPPLPGILHWTLTSTKQVSARPDFGVPSCGTGDSAHARPKSLAKTIELGQYSASDGTSAEELIYHYDSAADARQDFAALQPDSAACPSDHVVGKMPDGFAWEDVAQGQASTHKMVVLSGTAIAYWFHVTGSMSYDTSDDQAALMRMALRLNGGTPAPDPAPSANALPDSAWLAASQIPFATADLSHGWVPFGGQQQAPGSAPVADLCAAITDGDGFVGGGSGTVIMTRSYHGSPPNAPVYPGSNYLYSGADEHIVTFPGGPEQARSAFDAAKKITVARGCQFKDGSGEQTTRTIKVGTVTDAEFSILATDMPGPSYDHLYCVVKGSHVAWMMIDFEKGDTSTGGDAAILAAMAARLP